MRTTLARTAIAAALLAAVAPARAGESLADRKNAWPSEMTRRPLTLPKAMLELWLPVQLNASNGAEWKPVTLNPSLAVGITDRWMIGVRHIVGACLGGSKNGCPTRYDDVGAYTRLSLSRSARLELAIQGGVDWVHVPEPTNWAGWGGVVLRGGAGLLALTAAPSVSFGLKDRDSIPSRAQPIAWNAGSYDLVTSEQTFDNREHLSTPVTLQLQIGAALAVEVGASLEGPINPATSSFSSEYRVPAGAAVILTPLKSLDLGAAYTMPELGGNHGTTDVRYLSLFLALRT
jgi:hypothetical protein